MTTDGWLAAATIAIYAVAMLGCGLKGKWWLVVLSVFIPVFLPAALVGAFRLAKPDSLWAKFAYDETEMLSSIERFTTPAEFEEFEARQRAKNQGRTGLGGRVDPEMAAYGRIGASKDEIGEIAPPIN